MATAWSLSPSWQYAVCIGVAAALAALVERRIARKEAPVAAFEVEDRREAIATRISMELSFDRSQSVLESLREGVVVVDAGGEIVMANPAARRAMQRPYQDPVGKILWDVLAGDIARSAKEAWRALRDDTDGEAPVTAAAQIRRSSIESRDRFFDLTAVPVTSQQSGQDYGTLFLLVDATRNHELQQLKDRFLSSVSHELRTPLTNICAYSEILGSLVPGETAEWPEFVRVIHEESVQLSHLVDGMFDFLQLECGDAPFGVEPIDGVEAVRDILDSCRQKAEQNGIEFQVVERPCPQLIEVDRGRLEQVCRHLIDNAMKFTPRGGVVRVTCGDVDAGFELRIEDSGPGVPIDDRTNVFDKFTQLRDHMTDKPNGAGLGLATCRAIVGKLGGLIWCEDSSLGGAGFVVRLPLAGEPQLTGAGMMAGF